MQIDTYTILFILKFSIVTALLNIETKNFLSIGLSRPIIAGAILGYLGGNISYGIFVGCIIELLLINQLPIGAYIPPNMTIIIGVAMAISSYFHVYKSEILLPLIFIFAIFWGHIIKRISRLLWIKNSYLVESFIHNVQQMKVNFLIYNSLGLVMDFFIYLILIFIGNFLGLFFIDNIKYFFIHSSNLNFIFYKVVYYLPLFSLVFILHSFDVQKKYIFILVGIVLAILFDFILISPPIIIFIIGLFSFIVFYSLSLYREQSYEL